MKKSKNEKMRYSKPMIEITALNGNCLMQEGSVDYGNGINNPIKIGNPEGTGDYDNDYGNVEEEPISYKAWEKW